MMRINIKGGTPTSGKPLCITCKHAGVVGGQRGEQIIKCNGDMFSQSRHVVTFKVAECSSYHPINMPWRHEMDAMAWTIECKKRGAKGFELPEGEPITEIVISEPKRDNPRDTPWPDE